MFFFLFWNTFRKKKRLKNLYFRIEKFISLTIPNSEIYWLINYLLLNFQILNWKQNWTSWIKWLSKFAVLISVREIVRCLHYLCAYLNIFLYFKILCFKMIFLNACYANVLFYVHLWMSLNFHDIYLTLYCLKIIYSTI